MAVIKKDGGYMPLPISIKRGNPIPLDASSIWYDAVAMAEYAKTNVTAYVGQILVYVDEATAKSQVYVIANAAGDLTLVGEDANSGKAINVDNKTIELNDESLLKLKDFGSKYYSYIAASTDDEGNPVPATYKLQEVDEEHPWYSIVPTSLPQTAIENEEIGKLTNLASKGKFSSSSDGFAFLFTQVEANKNFKISVTGKVLQTATTKQAGFGLMLRDDCVIDQAAAGTIATNYLTAGIYANSSSQMYANFYRENASFKKGEEMNGMYAAGDTVTFTIERIGQTVHVTVVYNGATYTESYYDFDLFARDGGYMYVGMFANRGTVVEFTDLSFEITGESQGA